MTAVLRTVHRWLRGFRWFRLLRHALYASKRPIHRPPFSDRLFEEAVARTVVGSDWGVNPVAEYFRSRELPRFFVAPAETRALLAQLKEQHPHWMDDIERCVTEESRHRLSIYAREAPPLAPGFPWGKAGNGPGRDDLYDVRPHRFAFAPRWAIAVLLDGARERRFVALLEDWKAFAASGASSLPYRSNLVVAQRVLSLSWAWSMLASRASAGRQELMTERLLLQIIHEDVAYLHGRLGQSSPNNHLLVDAFIGWYVGLFFPEYAHEDWLERYEPMWLEQLSRQIHPDGTSFEHSTHYHEMACEMAVAYLLLSRRNGREPESWVCERIARMLRFQADVTGPSCVEIQIGNATEDPMFPLDTGSGWAGPAWRELYRAMFDGGAEAGPPGAVEAQRAFWLLGGAPQPRPQASDSVPGPRTYPDGGIYILEDAGGANRLLFRTGPAPEREVMAGHMHADLLSVLCEVSGQMILVDPGTYTYRGNPDSWPVDAPKWRRHLAGPTAHNCPVISRTDPLGELRGDFRDSRCPVAVSTQSITTSDRLVCIDARYIAEGQYDDLRRCVVQITGEYWLVLDVAPERIDPGDCSSGFQLAPQANLERLSDGKWRVRAGQADLTLVASGGLLEGAVEQGGLDPIAGWTSPAYGMLQPAMRLDFQNSGIARSTGFVLATGDAERRIRQLRVQRLDGGAIAVCVERDHGEDHLLLSTDAAASVESGTVTMHGQIGWLRITHGYPRELRLSHATAFRAADVGLDVSTLARKHVDYLEISGGRVLTAVGLDSPDSLVVNWPSRF